MRTSRLVLTSLALLLVVPAGSIPASDPPAPPLPRRGQDPQTDLVPRQPGDARVEPLEAVRARTEQDRKRVKSRAWYMTGRIRAVRGDWDGALEAFEQAVALDPQALAVYRQMLRAAIQLNRNDNIVRYAKKIVELDLDDYLLRQTLAGLLIRQRKVAEAIKMMEQAAKSRKLDHHSAAYVKVMNSLGLLYLGTGRQAAAADCYKVVFEALQNPKRFKLDDRTRRGLLADPKSSFEQMGRVFLAAKKPELAEAAFRADADAGRGDPGTLGFNLAGVYLQSGRPKPALKQLEKYFDRKLKTRGRAAYQLLADVLKQLKKSDRLVGRLEKLAEDDPDNPSLSVFLGDQYVAAARLDAAEQLYRAGLEKARGVDRVAAWAGLVKVYRQQEQAPGLLEALGESLAGHGDVKRLDQELARVSAKPKLRDAVLAEASRQAGKAGDSSPFTRRFAAARLAVAAKAGSVVALNRWALAANKPVASVRDRVLLESFRRQLDELGRQLTIDKKYDDASGLLRAAANDPPLRPFKPQFLFQLSQAYEYGGKTAQALAAIAEARRFSPRLSKLPLLDFQEAWIYYHAHQWDKAIPRFEALIKRLPADQFPNEKSIVRRCQFSLSSIYVQQGEIAKGEKILEQIFAEEPDNPSVNNDLGYLYADQGKKLKQAEQMIRKAIKAEPDNVAFLDSMGWVLYRLERFEEALPYLVKASARAEGGDATILDHLGDCRQKLKQLKLARESWTKALKLAREETRPDQKLIKKVEQKLKDTAPDGGDRDDSN